MGQQYPYSTRWKKNIVAILHIYGARAIFLVFFDHQETESLYFSLTGFCGPKSY